MKFIVLSSPHIVLLLFLAVCCPVLNAGDLTALIEPSTNATPAIRWSSLGATHGYAVEHRTNLQAGGWVFEATSDSWPISTTNWPLESDRTTAFYRIQAANRGHLVTQSLQHAYSEEALDSALAPYGLSADYDVAVRHVVYETFDHRGLSTLASGALAIPLDAPPMPLVSYQHGTIMKKLDAPSLQESQQLYGVVLAAQGYAVAMPDYLGLGTNSPGLHPYLHARSEAVACVDMLRASRRVLTNELGMTLNAQLFLLGYSQGGHATLALQRELELYHTNELPVVASAPMAGPYDLSGSTSDALLANKPYDNGAYVAYLLFGYNTVYPVFESASEILEPDYDTELPPLMDGMHSASEINAVMPAVPAHIFKSAYTNAFATDSNHLFRAILRSNDLYRWCPRVPTRLYHCSGDTVVPYANSETAYTQFVANGSTNVTLLDPAPWADHDDGVLPCFLAATAWFDTLKTEP